MIGLLACTYSMRQLTRLVEQIDPSSLTEPLRTTLKHADKQTSVNINAVSAALGPPAPSLQTIENQLTTAEDTIRQQYRQEEQKRLLGVVQALRSLDQAIASLAGADAHIFEREKRPERTSVGRNTAFYMLNRRDQEICQL